jgi:membrane fusion protein (multidrug efflux system)
VQELQGVFNVVVLGAGDTVEQRIVSPAERLGSLWVIPSGLKQGERIVVDGLQKVRPGMKVSAKTVEISDEKKEPANGAPDASKSAPEKSDEAK